MPRHRPTRPLSVWIGRAILVAATVVMGAGFFLGRANPTCARQVGLGMFAVADRAETDTDRYACTLVREREEEGDARIAATLTCTAKVPLRVLPGEARVQAESRSTARVAANTDDLARAAVGDAPVELAAGATHSWPVSVPVPPSQLGRLRLVVEALLRFPDPAAPDADPARGTLRLELEL